MKYGDCRVLKKNVTNKPFYSWYANLKTDFDKLSDDKKDALLSLGYERYTRDSVWETNLKLYREIKDKSYSTLTEEELKVYNWARRARFRYKLGTLDKTKVELVKELMLT